MYFLLSSSDASYVEQPFFMHSELGKSCNMYTDMTEHTKQWLYAISYEIFPDQFMHFATYCLFIEH